ncbi:ABC transporter ATP-binding protein [Clostridium sp. MB40-C1]|uniref:ABC transporter ATP-binding protein n=1 Tax=Clostridium sp. MB40-C1 TaxID=3070996 RepID=UPI0027DF8ADF|nr:ABC transporter ATP-binding protein [Clostridium sp. MB40-C1]WMJ80005.1 ABC transporter ATP-binding protein [Clostridium sp. MB40-C1]
MVSMEVKDLEKSYGKTKVLKQISFDINEGEITILAGPNGAGKTTTIKCILSLLKKDNGDVFIYGKSIKDKQVRERLAYIPENPDIYPYLTVWEHLKFIALAYCLENWQEKAMKILEMFNILDKKNEISKNLSKGMKQKVSISMALLHEPKIFLIDEPFIGLDPKGIKDFKDILKILRDEGKTILISTHILSSIEEISDRLIIMKKGKILVQGTKEELTSIAGFQGKMPLEDIFLKITDREKA